MNVKAFVEIKMIFSGDLQKIYITEVLHFLVSFNKSGMLKCCSSENESITFHLREGNLERIVNPYDDLKLGNMLFKRGYISDKELNRALKQQQELKKQLGEILIQLNLLTRQHLVKILRMQFEEIIFRIAEWQESTFSLEDFPDEEQCSAFIFSKTDQKLLKILEELCARIKDFKELTSKLPPDKTVLKTDKSSLEENKMILEKEENIQILKLADGSRSIREIRRECTFNTLEAQTAIYNLYKTGILKPPKN